MTTDNQRRANKHEAEVAEAFGGQTTPMSGAGWVKKGDVHTEHELIECKTTEAASYSLKLELLRSLQREAYLAGKEPVLDIRFEPRGDYPSRWVVIPESYYLEIERSLRWHEESAEAAKW